MWQGNWEVPSRSTKAFYAELLLWDLHIPFQQLDIVGRVYYGNISLDSHKTTFSAGAKPNLWYIKDGKMAFNILAQASKPESFTVKLTESTGIHQIYARSELLISISAGWQDVKAARDQGGGFWGTPRIEGNSSEGWAIAVASTQGLKGDSKIFTFTAIPPSAVERANFVFITELGGWDDWGNAVKTIHEMVVDLIP